METPREMLQRGDFVSPTFNYQPRLNKPVLSYWIVAAFYKVFGVSVGVQRLPIALAAVTIILAALLLARSAGNLEAGLWTAAGLAVAPRLVMFGRRIFIDIYISMFMALTLMFFALAERYPQRRRLFLLLMYASVGLGVLTKGPVAAALPALVFGLYLVLHRELRRITEMMIPIGLIVVLAIVVPWYAALYHRYGWTYITSFIVGENIARYTEGLGVEQRRGLSFYLPVVFSDSFPWSLCLFGAAALWIGSSPAWSGNAASDRGFRIRTLLWLWILVIVIFFTFSAAKQDLYIFPIVPAVAALAGLFIARRDGPKAHRGLERFARRRSSSACCSPSPAPGRSTSSRPWGRCMRCMAPRSSAAPPRLAVHSRSVSRSSTARVWRSSLCWSRSSRSIGSSSFASFQASSATNRFHR